MLDCPNCGQPIADDNCRYAQVDAAVIEMHEDCARAALAQAETVAPPAPDGQEVERRNALIFAIKNDLRADPRFAKWADGPLLGFAVKMYDLAHGERT